MKNLFRKTNKNDSKCKINQIKVNRFTGFEPSTRL